MKTPSPHARSPRKHSRALRLAAWNALLVISGLLLIALAGEAYLRVANPFIESSLPTQFVDGVGVTREPNAEMRYANWHDDNFVVSRTNSLGFLDREPARAERAAAGCHIAFIGDSFVEAREVAIADKFHVRLEEKAARELPHLDISTQAWGMSNTGQIQQIPFYDEYARRLNPKVVVLVFFVNDFVNNSLALHAGGSDADPDRLPYMSAQRDESGVIRLRSPNPELSPILPTRRQDRPWNWLIEISYFAKWLDNKRYAVMNGFNAIRARMGASAVTEIGVEAHVDMIAATPCCDAPPDVRLPHRWQLAAAFTQERLPSVFQEALEYTAFAMDQFKRRADRDGATLAILAASGDIGTPGEPQFNRLSAIAEERDIPIISDYDYIVRQGNAPEDGRWGSNRHWNAIGHQWAAEAVLEWLKANQDVCD